MMMRVRRTPAALRTVVQVSSALLCSVLLSSVVWGIVETIYNRSEEEESRSQNC
jgi:hypothetical protein